MNPQRPRGTLRSRRQCSSPLPRQPSDRLAPRSRLLPVVESFFATVKTELIHRRAWPTREAATSALFNYIEGWYNTRRRQSTLGYLSPATYESTHANTHQQVA